MGAPGRSIFIVTPDFHPAAQTNVSGQDAVNQGLAGVAGTGVGLDAGLRIGSGSNGGQIAAAPDVQGASAFAWLLAFAVVIFILWLLNKTRIGHALLYYLLALAVISLLLINYRWLAGVLSPLTQFGSSSN